MAFYSPTPEEHGRISAVTATKILQRMVQGEDNNDPIDKKNKRNGRKKKRKKRYVKITHRKHQTTESTLPAAENVPDIGFMEKMILRNDQLERQTARIHEDFTTLTEDVQLLVKEKDDLRAVVEKYKEENTRLKEKNKSNDRISRSVK